MKGTTSRIWIQKDSGRRNAKEKPLNGHTERERVRETSDVDKGNKSKTDI